LTNIEKLCYSAAVTTFITGLHLTFIPNLIGISGYTSLLFLITGIAQLFGSYQFWKNGVIFGTMWVWAGPSSYWQYGW